MKRGITIIGIGVTAAALVAAGYHAQNRQLETQPVAAGGDRDTAQPVATDERDMTPVEAGAADAGEPTAPAAAEPASGLADSPTPTSAAALVHSARALLGAGDRAAAEARALAATRLDPRSAPAWHVLGRTQLARGGAVEAEASFRHACELDSTNAFAANNLGYVRLLRGDWQAARGPLETAVALRDDVAYFHNNLGVVYERLGLLDLAAQSYARAVELDSDHSMARVSLARVQSHRGPDARQLARSDADSVETPARTVEP